MIFILKISSAVRHRLDIAPEHLIFIVFCYQHVFLVCLVLKEWKISIFSFNIILGSKPVSPHDLNTLKKIIKIQIAKEQGFQRCCWSSCSFILIDPKRCSKYINGNKNKKKQQKNVREKSMTKLNLMEIFNIETVILEIVLLFDLCWKNFLEEKGDCTVTWFFESH